MPPTRPTDAMLVVAWIAAGTQKEAAHDLGLTLPAYRSRVRRLYRAYAVHSIYALLLALPDAPRGARPNVVWRPAEDPRTL